MSRPNWKKFEQAVAAFLQALDPTARVMHDVSIPDADTGEPRQRDVWIETRVMGLPITIYVSCKDVGRPLSQQDMDAVIGELRSSKAHVGVVYATGGFSKHAITKARNVGIHCCQLYADQPPTIPEHLFLPVFLCEPEAYLYVEGDPERVIGVSTFEELFAYDGNSPDGRPVIDHLGEMFFETVREASTESLAKGQLPPDNIARRLALGSHETGEEFVMFTVFRFDFYEGKIECHLLDGSYCVSSGEFIGSMKAPPVLMGEEYPGPYYTRVDRSVLEKRDAYGCFMLFPHSYTDRIRESMCGPIAARRAADVEPPRA